MTGTAACGARLLAGSVAGVGAGLLALTAVTHHRATRRPGSIPPDGPGAIVVLGLPGTNRVLRSVQRWRVDLALDLWRTGRFERVVFTGGAVRSARSEASEMAALAVAGGLDEAAVVLDEVSRSTWGNVVEASRLVGPVAVVALASDAAHAARARTYWWDQHGPDGPELVLADRGGLVDHLWIRVPGTAVELIHRVRRRWRPPVI